METKLQASLIRKIMLGLGTAAFALGVGLAVFSIFSLQKAPETSEPSTEQLTSQLRSLLVQYESTPTHQRIPIEAQLRRIAEKRFTKVSALATENPKKFLEQKVSASITTPLPQDIQKFVESDIQTEGTLTKFHGDNFDRQTSSDTFTLLAGSNTYVVSFSESNSVLRSQSTAHINGVRLGEKIVVDTKQFIESNSAPIQPAVSGVKKGAIIMINFQNVSITPADPNFYKGVVFTNPDSIQDYFKQNSADQLTFAGHLNTTGDVFGPVTVPYQSSSACNYAQWLTSAEGQILSAGYNSANYDFVILVSPSATSCSNPGYASGKWVYISSAGSFTTRTVGHEVGHTFGLQHASGWYCYSGASQVTLGSSCVPQEYADQFDIMGNSGKRLLNSYHQDQLGWLAASSVQDVTSPLAQYTLYPLHASPGSPAALRSLRVFRDYTAGVGAEYYYIEYRQPFGTVFDNFAAGDPAVTGISIRIAKDPSVGYQSHMVDANPSNPVVWADAPFAVGRTLSDPTRGIQIRVVSIAADRSNAVVEVTQNCTRRQPNISVAPFLGWGKAGSSIQYTVTVTNTDSPQCGNSAFSLIPTLPAGWTSSASPSSATIAPIGVAPITLTITSPVNAVDGPASFNLVTTNTSSGQNKTTSINYTIDSVAPVINIDAPADGMILSSNTSFQAHASTTDAGSVSTVEVYLDSQLLARCSPYDRFAGCGATINPTTLVAGSHTIRYTAIDAALNSSEAKYSFCKPQVFGPRNSCATSALPE